MNTQTQSNVEDTSCPDHGFRYLLANGNLDFKAAVVNDPVPLGRQLLVGGGLDPRQGFSLFAVLPTGDFEDVRLDEQFDLRGKGAEKFIAFLTDRDFKLTLGDSQLEWGYPVISGSELFRLAKVKDGDAVFRRMPGGTDALIEPTDLVRLDDAGIEKFITAPRPKPTFDIVVNARHRVLNDPVVTFEQIVAIAFPGAYEPNVVFTVTYRNAASKPQGGNLAVGGSVTVKKEGTIFNVTRTVQS